MVYSLDKSFFSLFFVLDTRDKSVKKNGMTKTYGDKFEAWWHFKLEVRELHSDKVRSENRSEYNEKVRQADNWGEDL